MLPWTRTLIKNHQTITFFFTPSVESCSVTRKLLLLVPNIKRLIIYLLRITCKSSSGAELKPLNHSNCLGARYALLVIHCRPSNSEISSYCQSNAFSSSGKRQLCAGVKSYATTKQMDFSGWNKRQRLIRICLGTSG
jgi:hypothetical protein